MGQIHRSDWYTDIDRSIDKYIFRWIDKWVWIFYLERSRFYFWQSHKNWTYFTCSFSSLQMVPNGITNIWIADGGKKGNFYNTTLRKSTFFLERKVDSILSSFKNSTEIYVKLISKPRLPLSNDCTQVTKWIKTLMFMLY